MTSPNPPVGYYTPKLGLRVDSLDDEMDSARENWDRLDSAQGALWVAADVTPSESQLYEGAVVAEIGTGKVWRAEKDINGNYQKKWLKFPWLASLSVSQGFAPNDVSSHTWGWTTVSATESVNCTQSDLVNNKLVVPVTGLYSGVGIMRWEITSSTPGGERSYRMQINGIDKTTETETIKTPGYQNQCMHQCYFTFHLNAGDNICGAIWQNAPGSQGVTTHLLTMTLVKPT